MLVKSKSGVCTGKSRKTEVTALMATLLRPYLEGISFKI